MQWLAAKAKLLLCALETVDTDGLGLIKLRQAAHLFPETIRRYL
jgi:hypothetical protein